MILLLVVAGLAGLAVGADRRVHRVVVGIAEGLPLVT